MFGEQQATSLPIPSPNPAPPQADASLYQNLHGFNGEGARPAFDLGRAAAPQHAMISQNTDSSTYEHQVVNDAMVTTKQPEKIQPMKCEVCNVCCDTKDTLEKHKQGKKHLKNMQKLGISSVIAPKTPLVAAIATSGEELENKKQKLLQNGALVDGLIYCETCNVVCNDQDVFKNHIAGKKHLAKAILQLASKNGVFNPTSDTVSEVQPSNGDSEKNVETVHRVFNPTSDSGSEAQPTVHHWRCELCKISCTSEYELTNMHMSGKKHLKKLKESEQIPDPSLTLVASLDPPPAKTMQNPESIEGKAVNSHEVNPVRCELCGISCDTYDMLKIHISGKKHRKNVEKSEKPIEPNLAPEPLQDSPKEEGKIVNVNGSNQEAKRTESNEDLGTKKQEIVQIPDPSLTLVASLDPPPAKTMQNPESIEGKAVNSHEVNPVRCELCGISCDTYDMLKIHISGKKHRKNVEKSEKPIEPNLAPEPLQDSPKEEGKIVNVNGGNQEAKRMESNEDLGTKKQEIVQIPNPPLTLVASLDTPPTKPMQNPESIEGKSVNSHGGNPVRCELCGISCDTYNMLRIHISGKKHQKNLEKSEKPVGSNSAPSNEPMMIDTVQDSFKEEGKVVNVNVSKRKAKRVGSEEDIETKKQKILQGGGTLDAIRTCTVCNVVCSSQIVYNDHVTGRKHAAMAVKQAEAGLTGQET